MDKIGKRYFFSKRMGDISSSIPWWYIITAMVDGPTTVTVGIIHGTQKEAPRETFVIDALYGPAANQTADMLSWFNHCLGRKGKEKPNPCLYPERIPVKSSSGKPGDTATFVDDALAIARSLRLKKKLDTWSVE